jgi:hypothetical protein
MRRQSGYFSGLYVIIGIIIAYTHGYLAAIGTLSGILSAVLAVFLWPLVLIGIHLNIAL